MSRLKRLAREGGWIVIGQIAAVAGAVVLVRVLTEILDPAQYGELALGLTVAGLVNQVVLGAIANGISRFYSVAAEKNDLAAYLQDTGRLLGYATLVLVTISVLLIAALLWLGYSKWVALAATALVYSVLSGYNVALNGIQNAARQRAIVAFHGGLDAWLKIGLAAGIVLWLGASSSAVVIGYAASSLFTTASQLVFLRRTIPRREAQVPHVRRWLWPMWAYSAPFSAWGIFTWLQQVSDRWALQAFGSSADVGQYAVVFQLGYSTIAVFTGLASGFLAPILYQLSGDASNHSRNANVHRLCWGMTYVALTITLLGVAVTLAMHRWIFRLLVAAEYASTSYLLPWMVLAGGLFAAGQMLGLKMMSDIRSSAMTTAKIVTALIGTLLNVLGAAYAGVHGVIGALVAFSAIYFVWIATLAARVNTSTYSLSSPR